MGRGARVVAALASIIGVLGVAVVAVRASYGAFKSGYTLTGVFDKAAYGFGPNTEIDYRGVDVGHVTHVHLLPDHRVQAGLRIDSGFRVPSGTKAEVQERSLFGDPFVALVLPGGTPRRYLAAGDRIELTSVDADTTDLIATASPLLSQINGHDLLTLVTELQQATAGEGPRIAQSIHDGAQLAALYAETIDAQLKALNSFSAFQAAIAPDAPELNTLATQTNAALPTLNAAEGDFQQALETVRPFADKLANVIAQERPNFDALLARGDNVVRLLTMREPQIEQVVSGLADYLEKFALVASPETLPNGTKFAYFKNFVELSDIQQLICGLLAPPQGGLLPAQLQPILTGLAGTALMCTAPAPKGSAPAAAAPPPPDPKAAANDLVNQIAGQITAPQQPVAGTVQGLINSLLGSG